VLERWQDTLVQARESSLTTQSWLWARRRPSIRHGKLMSCWSGSRCHIGSGCNTTCGISRMICCVVMHVAWHHVHRQPAG
jgi:hypothetical protein